MFPNGGSNCPENPVWQGQNQQCHTNLQGEVLGGLTLRSAQDGVNSLPGLRVLLEL